MEKLFDWLIGKTDKKNWLIFSVVLSVMTIYFIDKIHEDLWSWHLFWYIIPYFNFNPTHLLFEDEKNLTFLVSEIILTSMALTRVLIAFDILHIIQRTPILADVINWVIKERRERILLLYRIINSHFELYPKTQKVFCKNILGYLESKTSDNKYYAGEENTVGLCFRNEIYNTYIDEAKFLYNYDYDSNVWKNMNNAYKNAVRYKVITNTSIPDYLYREIDKKFDGYLLQRKPLFKIKNREIKLGHIYALASLFFALCVIL